MGVIPRALGKLSNLYWLDLADNQLSGSIPTSIIASKGLNSLKKAKHLLFDGNWLGGSIPDSIAEIQTLEVLFFPLMILEDQPRHFDKRRCCSDNRHGLQKTLQTDGVDPANELVHGAKEHNPSYLIG
ncbi:hypothetical protein AgCh_017309 [Apium graveolens]